MAVCGSRTSHIGHFVGNITARRLQYGLSMNCTVSYNKRGFEKVGKINTSLRNNGHPNNMLFQYFTTHVTKRWADPKSYIGFGSKGLHNLSPACFSSGTASAPGVSSDNAKGEEQVANTAVDSSEAKIPLKLNSGSFYLPHPAKAKTGGEDAHFMCTLTQAIGVADGVGGWADLGIDAGVYARELMSNSLAAIQEEPKGSIDLIRALDKAYVRTKAKGSSTACIVALTDEGLYAVNLGDSGFMLVRHGYAAFKSPAQQHTFNFPYQLDCNKAGDSPSSAMVFKIAVAPGDVVIAGTDGLFDNLYDEDIKGVVLQSVEAGLGPQMTAQRIAELAQLRAMDPNKSSPFSDGAQEAGFEYHGGKLDDITVVVSYITTTTTTQ